jgi:hypothetical protein
VFGVCFIEGWTARINRVVPPRDCVRRDHFCRRGDIELRE